MFIRQLINLKEVRTESFKEVRTENLKFRTDL